VHEKCLQTPTLICQQVEINTTECTCECTFRQSKGDIVTTFYSEIPLVMTLHRVITVNAITYHSLSLPLFFNHFQHLVLYNKCIPIVRLFHNTTGLQKCCPPIHLCLI